MVQVRTCKNIVVGFGFSAIPLIKELENSGEPFLIISGKDTMWRALENRNRLDFDLVSSKFTSFYSFDLVEQLSDDTFPASREFYEYQMRYFKRYEDRIIDDHIELVENLDDCTLLRTKSGKTYQAENVILATGYSRKITESILNFDTDISGKTVVLDSIGDTANMLISKLIGKNNRIIVRQNGFIPTDKISRWEKTYGTLDQAEFHTVGFYLKNTYMDIIVGSMAGPLVMLPFDIMKRLFKELVANPAITLLNKTMLLTRIGFAILSRYVALIFERNIFTTMAMTSRDLPGLVRVPKMPYPNGFILIKYWPIDVYHEFFAKGKSDDELQKQIETGYVINDLPFFVNEGLVELCPKRQTAIDKENKTISWNSEKIEYDFLIEGGPETPRLPDIKIRHSGKDEPYEYNFRENYFGVIPKKLKNVYFMGLARPISGGIACVNELASLLLHKTLTDKEFQQKTYEQIEEKLAKYNHEHYLTDTSTKTDHLVYYGFYNEEVAREVGINLKLSDCRSFKDLYHYFIFPNNAFKYRVNGKYAITGTDKLVQKARDEYDNHRASFYIVNNYLLYRLMAFIATVMAFVGNVIPLWATAILVLTQVFGTRFFMLPTQYYWGQFKAIYLAVFCIALPFVGLTWLPAMLLFDVAVTFVMRKRGHRLIFNDFSTRNPLKSFFYDRYLPILQKTYRSRKASNNQASNKNNHELKGVA